MLDQPVKGLLWRHAFVKVDRDGRVAQAERQAVVCLFVRDADRHLNRFRGGVRRNVQAVVITADA